MTKPIMKLSIFILECHYTFAIAALPSIIVEQVCSYVQVPVRG